MGERKKKRKKERVTLTGRQVSGSKRGKSQEGKVRDRNCNSEDSGESKNYVMFIRNLQIFEKKI